MATIDERIKAELENETDLLDELMPEAVLHDIGTRTATIFIGIALLIVAIGVYCLIQFVGATSLPDTIRWGIWFLVCFIGLVFIELWAWMLIGRLATKRETKQLEINIRQFIAAKLE